MRKISMLIMGLHGYIHFRRWGVFLRSRAMVGGKKYISLGFRFGAGRHFWIDAIDRYNLQKFTPQIKIGDNVSLSDFCHIASINRITIGDNVLIGSRVHITDHYHGNYSSSSLADSPSTSPIARPLYSPGRVDIGKNVWIGDGVVILPNVTIGDGAVVGANSVVNRDIPAGSIAVGAPAKAVKTYKDGTWKRVEF